MNISSIVNKNIYSTHFFERVRDSRCPVMDVKFVTESTSSSVLSKRLKSIYVRKPTRKETHYQCRIVCTDNLQQLSRGAEKLREHLLGELT